MGSGWKIKRIPYDQFGSFQYQRVYGWGWLSPISMLMLIAGAIGLATNVKIDEEWLVGMIFVGFVLIWVGMFLNAYSERKSMDVIDAKCLDVQIKSIGATTKRSAGFAVRALVEYEYNNETHQSTPMASGYAYFYNEDSAKEFNQSLLSEKNIKLYVDPKRPKRTLFYDLDAGRK